MRHLVFLFRSFHIKKVVCFLLLCFFSKHPYLYPTLSHYPCFAPFLLKQETILGCIVGTLLCDCKSIRINMTNAE